MDYDAVYNDCGHFGPGYFWRHLRDFCH